MNWSMQCGLSVGLAVWRRRQREFLQVLDINTQLLLLLLVVVLLMQCAGGTTESWRRHAVRRLTERHLRPGASSTAAVASCRRRVQHEVDRKRKYDGGVLFCGDLRHGLQVAQLQRVGRFVDNIRRLLERVRRFLLAFRRYNLHTTQHISPFLTHFVLPLFVENDRLENDGPNS